VGESEFTLTSEDGWPEAWFEMAFLVFSYFIVRRKTSIDVKKVLLLLSTQAKAPELAGPERHCSER